MYAWGGTLFGGSLQAEVATGEDALLWLVSYLKVAFGLGPRQYLS